MVFCRWRHGPVNVHIQPRHAGIYGQWIDSWRPTPDSTEIAIIVEDDLTLSPKFYLWLREAYAKYHTDPSIMGFSLRGNMIVKGPRTNRWLRTDRSHTAFMYKLIGTHGFAPLPRFWREFQDWYHIHRKKPKFRPYVRNIVLTKWYKSFEKQGRQGSMWEMWLTYFGYIKKKFVVYPNLSVFKGGKGELIVHRAEKGLHSNGGAGKNQIPRLLQSWKSSYSRMPDNIFKYDWNGKKVTVY